MRNVGRDKAIHSYMQSTLDIDVSWHGGIPPGRPPYQEMMRDASHLVAPLIDSRGVRTLGELGTILRVLGKLKERRGILPTSSLPTLISDPALWQEQHGKDSNLPTCIFGI